MSIAFVFVLVGYGSKVGLVPLHFWLPDAHSEGPTPVSAVLSGLLLNVALYAVVRVKMLVDGALKAGTASSPHLAGYLMMGFGLLSFVVAGLILQRQRDIKRLFSYSSIEHMGLMTFAFGMGGPLATFGALLHMTVHSLTKSAIFVTAGHAAHIAGTQTMDRIRGLIRTQPTVGWGLLIGTAAIAGFPPFGVFTSEFLLLTATIQDWPWLTAPLLIGLGVAFAGLFRAVHPMVYGPVPEGQQPVPANMLPVAIHLILALCLGIAIPDFLARWFDEATWLISGIRLL
jgi:hydrogenase-4 component F